MLRAPRPETTALSKTGAAPALAGGAVTGGGGGAPGAATTTRPTLAPAGGKWNTPSSISRLASPRVYVVKALRGTSLPPDAMAKGNHTPATCS